MSLVTTLHSTCPFTGAAWTTNEIPAYSIVTKFTSTFFPLYSSSIMNILDGFAPMLQMLKDRMIMLSFCVPYWSRSLNQCYEALETFDLSE